MRVIGKAQPATLATHVMTGCKARDGSSTLDRNMPSRPGIGGCSQPKQHSQSNAEG